MNGLPPRRDRHPHNYDFDKLQVHRWPGVTRMQLFASASDRRRGSSPSSPSGSRSSPSTSSSASTRVSSRTPRPCGCGSSSSASSLRSCSSPFRRFRSSSRRSPDRSSRSLRATSSVRSGAPSTVSRASSSGERDRVLAREAVRPVVRRRHPPRGRGHPLRRIRRHRRRSGIVRVRYHPRPPRRRDLLFKWTHEVEAPHLHRRDQRRSTAGVRVHGLRRRQDRRRTGSSPDSRSSSSSSSRRWSATTNRETVRDLVARIEPRLPFK